MFEGKRLTERIEMPINPNHPFELVHSVEAAEAPTDGRAILYVADEFVADLIERSERIRPIFIDPPDMTPEMRRKRTTRIRGLVPQAHDPEEIG